MGGRVNRWRRIPRRRRLLAAGPALVLALLAVPAVWAVHYRMTYRTFAWWRPPVIFHYCGLDHFADGTMTPAEVHQDYPGFAIRPARTLPPDGHMSYAVVESGPGALTGCAGISMIYLPLGNGRVLNYANP